MLVAFSDEFDGILDIAADPFVVVVVVVVVVLLCFVVQICMFRRKEH